MIGTSLALKGLRVLPKTRLNQIREEHGRVAVDVDAVGAKDIARNNLRGLSPGVYVVQPLQDGVVRFGGALKEGFHKKVAVLGGFLAQEAALQGGDGLGALGLGALGLGVLLRRRGARGVTTGWGKLLPAWTLASFLLRQGLCVFGGGAPLKALPERFWLGIFWRHRVRLLFWTLRGRVRCWNAAVWGCFC